MFRGERKHAGSLGVVVRPHQVEIEKADRRRRPEFGSLLNGIEAGLSKRVHTDAS